jgi:hypothetical protein
VLLLLPLALLLLWVLLLWVLLHSITTVDSARALLPTCKSDHFTHMLGSPLDNSLSLMPGVYLKDVPANLVQAGAVVQPAATCRQGPSCVCVRGGWCVAVAGLGTHGDQGRWGSTWMKYLPLFKHAWFYAT